MLLLAVTTPCASAAAQQTITFEDVTGPTQLGAGYRGFDWQRFFVIDGTTVGAGYANAIVSGDSVVFGPGQEYVSTMSSASAFTFNSAFFTSAFTDGAMMTVKGYAAPAGYPPPEDPTPFTQGSATYFAQFLINAESPVQLRFDWTDVYRVTFTSTGGTLAPVFGDPFGYGYFAVDDIAVDYAVVPEPSALLLTATMFAGLAAMMIPSFIRRIRYIRLM
jgi:hypothetical protein